MTRREMDKWPCLKLKALAGIKDTRRLWQDINPREFIGGLVYDVDSGEVGLVTVDTSLGEWPEPKWSELYLYLLVWDYKPGWVRQGGQFARRLVPLLPPWIAARMVGQFGPTQEEQRLHAGQWVFSFERTSPPYAEPTAPLFEDDSAAHNNESNNGGDEHER